MDIVVETLYNFVRGSKKKRAFFQGQFAWNVHVLKSKKYDTYPTYNQHSKILRSNYIVILRMSITTIASNMLIAFGRLSRKLCTLVILAFVIQIRHTLVCVESPFNC